MARFQFTITCQEQIDAVAKRLGAQVEPRRTFLRLTDKHKPFEGCVSKGDFKVTRIIHYATSFLPVATGVFRATGQGTDVIVQMRPSISCCFSVCAVVVALWGLWLIDRLADVLANGPHWLEMALLCGMTAVPLVLGAINFSWEARIYERELRCIIHDSIAGGP